ncbi:outer membrane beta-barrel protein [Tenacibaculum ovolyticum]|uniref:outer membrane beta-barrel protein n=1 Tax=Tenacibaculum ovolyticum TaxID=104270 RepID=UPI0022F380B9|nr:outer membrane beta-barrel protein [Tenacibaculum ovolyticum]WBX74970.1 outer membrane beta-barrel protein [Tenacibaculum ovolyticum]
MKKLLLAITIVAAGFTVNAQEEVKGGFSKKDIYISGTVGYSNVSTGDVDASGYTLSPSVGYFVSDKIALELGLVIGSSDNTTTKTNSFGASLGANYFFTPSKDFSFILGAGLGYSSTGSELLGVDQPDVNTFTIAVAPGINYFVSKSLALRATVGALSYSSSKLDVNGAKSTNTFGLNLNLSDVNFGLTYKF